MKTLEKAILDENLTLVKQLLTTYPNLIDEKTSCGMLLPQLAAKTGNENILKYIVEYSRASFNLGDNNNSNILHFATISGNLSLVKYITEKVGISPISGDNNLVTPFDLSRKLGFKEIENYYTSICGFDLDNACRNPIRTGMHPDPSIVRVDEDYYMVNSSFIYFPCIPISHSKDLVNWRVIGHAITNPEWANLDDLESGRGYWAPDISYDKGVYYITATYRLNDNGNVYRKQIVVTSKNPEGPYSKPAIIDEDGIDPSIFTDDDGKKYMLLNRGARVFEISKDGTEKISDATLLYYGDNKRAPEGPHLLKKDGYYYLFLAEGGTGTNHQISVMRSRALMGNYEPCPYNPIMQQKKSNEPIQRCGHGKPVMTQNGQWYMFYLCGRMLDGKYSLLGRETALDPITWTNDNWPIVNNLQGPSILQKKPDLPITECNNKLPSFDGEPTLTKDWVSPRAPQPDAYKIENGILKIKASKYNLNSVNSRNLLLVSQKHFNFEVNCSYKYDNLQISQDLGLVCYYDENTYLKFCVSNINDKFYLNVFERIDAINRLSLSIELNVGKKIFTKIITSGLSREFLYSYDNIDWMSLGTIENVYYLCDEGIQRGKRFTGAMVGMYVYGNGTDNFYGEFYNFKYLAYTPERTHY